ncbi:hypothetical protein [Paucisalibacillus globulus]|uniref:hypothetical protein n=1 Tax=Paucisalibacillus globulus TaxID=351095 RepID=UPI000BB8AF41|nr:hypothetical protein [Paucisalibacillus globulus]
MQKKWYVLILLWVLFLVGCSSHETKEIMLEIPYENYLHPSMNDEVLYVTVGQRMSSDAVDTLIRFEPDTGKAEELYSSEFPDSYMQDTQANDSWLIWVDQTSDGTISKLLGMNLSNQSVKEITTTDPNYPIILSPKLFEDFVAWTELGNEQQFEVKLHNLKKNETVTIATLQEPSIYNSFVSIGEDKLLWADTKEGKGYYMLYDLKEKTTETYEAPTSHPGYPKYTNGKIFAINFVNDGNWTNQDFGYLDIKENQYYSINKKEYYINYFDTYDDRLAILDSENNLTVYDYKNGELTPLDITITDEQESTPLFLYFVHEGHLMLQYDSLENIGDSKIGIIYSN